MKHTINVIIEIMILPYEVQCAVTFSPICVLVDFELSYSPETSRC